MSNNKAFTLIEILVVMTIFSIFIAIGTTYIAQSFKSTTFDREEAEAVKTARDAMEITIKEIRGANSSEQGDYTLAKIADFDFIFYSDTNDDGKMEKIEYYREGSFLKRSETPPGPLNDYNVASSTSIVARYLNNREDPIFTYYDSGYVNTNVINNVRLINIYLKINVTPERMPADQIVETDVTLRNLKSNL